MQIFGKSMFQMKGIGNQAPGDGGGGDVPRGFRNREETCVVVGAK